MKKINSSVILIVACVICLFLITPNAYCQVSGVYGPAAISTGHEEETPTIVLDAAGNAHIVWASDVVLIEDDDDGDDDDDDDDYEPHQFLFYKMVDRDGNVVIPETNVNPCTSPDFAHVRRPSIGIDASGQIHIVFHGFSLYTNHGSSGYTGRNDLVSSEIIYTKINPAAYLAGGISDLDDLIVIPETLITPDDEVRSRAPNLAVDAANGRVHIVWFDGGEQPFRPEAIELMRSARADVELHYRVMNLSGGQIVPITTLTSGLHIDVDWGEPEIVLDGNGNAHIVYAEDLDGSSGEEDGSRDDREVFYTVVAVSGNSATTLIGDTMITAEDGHASTRAQLAIDANGMVHVIWHDRRFADNNGRAPEIFYCKLNPNPGNGTVGYVITEAQVTPDNDKKSNQKGIAIDNCGRVNIAWGEGGGGEGGQDEDRDLYYQIFDSSSGSLNQVIPAYRVTGGEALFWPAIWTFSSSRNPHLAISDDNRVFITFPGGLAPNADSSWMEIKHDIYLAIIDAPPCLEMPIPTVTTWGMIFLFMLLSGIGLRVFIRRAKTG